MGLHQGTSSRERGFTLIELMIVVAVIAILSAVVIPTFFRESRKVKSGTEVAPMFSELAIREEQWKVDNGSYRDVAECPTTTTPAGSPSSTCLATTDWTAMRINPPEATLRCKYQVVTGTASGVVNPSGFVFVAPDASWFYLLATCDGDGQTTTNATYFSSSVDSAIQKLNEGQ